MVADSHTISPAVHLCWSAAVSWIELIGSAARTRTDMTSYMTFWYATKGLKRIYAYKLNTYWNNIASVDAYYQTNMDF